MSDDSESTKLHLKYRPQTFAEVIGQSAVVKSLKSAIAGKSSQSFLLSGPSGNGKTTLARIAAREAGCIGANITEINGAKFTGIDDMRAIQDLVQYRPFGKSGVRAVILDEAHRLSKNAWDSLLKLVEEAPDHLFWFFCTTEPDKVPLTIRTRCAIVRLKMLDDRDLTTILDDVIAAEKIKLASGVFDVVLRESRGSARQALVNLAQCRSADNRREAADILNTVLDTDGVIELCRFLTGSARTWSKAMAIVEKLKDDNPESVRIQVVNYVGAVLRNAKNDDAAKRTLDLLSDFSTPFNASEGNSPLLLAIGRTLFQ